MEIGIKCSSCSRSTRNFELGEIFYLAGNASKSIIVKDAIICPKCSKDISNNKCMVKENELLISFVAANLCLSEGGVPKHLQGAFPLNKKDYEFIKGKCKSRLKFI